MTDTQQEPVEEAVEVPEPSPEYLDLPKSEREAVDSLLAAMQGMQNDVDRMIAIMGEPVFFLGREIIRLDLQVRSMKRVVLDLQRRLTDLEDRVS